MLVRLLLLPTLRRKRGMFFLPCDGSGMVREGPVSVGLFEEVPRCCSKGGPKNVEGGSSFENVSKKHGGVW